MRDKLYLRGKRLSNKEFQTFILDEIDRATSLPENFDELICAFINYPRDSDLKERDKIYGHFYDKTNVKEKK